MAPRDLDNELHGQKDDGPVAQPRRVKHLLVHEGGRKTRIAVGAGPLGRPTPVAPSGRRTAGTLL